MRIAILRERATGETRVAATPETVKKFIALGVTIAVEPGAGACAAIPDADYAAAACCLVMLKRLSSTWSRNCRTWLNNVRPNARRKGLSRWGHVGKIR